MPLPVDRYVSSKAELNMTSWSPIQVIGLFESTQDGICIDGARAKRTP